MLARLGAVVVDADQLSRQVVAPGSATLQQICNRFGNQILLPDGNLDRKKMRLLVFDSSDKRRELEEILHPAIRQAATEQLELLKRSGTKVAVYMAPLLIETGAAEKVDQIWVVTVNPQIQQLRLMKRDHCNLEQARQIIAAQMPLGEKEKQADFLIDNSGSLEETCRQVEDGWRQRITGYDQ